MFCKTVWNGIHILPDGYIRLCSLGTNNKKELDMQRCRDSAGNVMHILTHSIEEIMNSDKHKEVRLLNAQNPDKWSPHCECCENREKIINFDRTHPNKSRRLYLMNVDDKNTDETNFKDKINSDGSINWYPSSLDIRFGNLCNQKCVMCSPTFSNQWYDEYVDYYKTYEFGQGKKIKIAKDPQTNKWMNPVELQWYEDPRWWIQFEKMMPHLRHIYITGGEPMVTPAHDEMLDRLISSDYAKNIWLEYDTNCSAINHKITSKWNKFKTVHIRGSMDAIKDQYEIIRFPGNWLKFQENVKKLKEIETKSNRQIKLLSLSSCFQIPTIYSVIESENWCKSIGVDFHLRFLEGPEKLSVAILSDKSKTDLINYYTSFLKTSKKAPMVINYLKNHLGNNFYKPESINEFIRFMNFLDKTRNTDWKKIFPEVLDLLEKNEILLVR